MTAIGIRGRRDSGTLVGMTVAEKIRMLGGVAHRSEILRSGVTPYELGRARHDGTILRVRRAWYATHDANFNVVRAVRVGGSLTSVSEAQRPDLWVIDDGQLHVSVPRNGGRLRSDRTRFVDLSDEPDAPVCIHWRRSPGADTLTAQPPIRVLIDIVECQSEERALATIDSALNSGLVDLDDLTSVFAGLPRRYRRALAKADGASQSGTETIVRVRLRALGIRCRPQAVCGTAHVDVLVGDRLVIECHSRAHHTGVENYARDRERELRLVDGDYLTLTLSYEQVLFDWPHIESVIRRIIARRDHLWPRTA